MLLRYVGVGGEEMDFLLIWQIANLLLLAALCGGILYVLVLVVKALKKYIRSENVREEKKKINRAGKAVSY